MGETILFWEALWYHPSLQQTAFAKLANEAQEWCVETIKD